MPIMKTYKPKDHGLKVPVLVWTDSVEESAEKQLFNVAKLPFVKRHIAVMPDVHAGYGVTIGSVVPTQGAVIPYAVGVDIGCGMMAVKTDLNVDHVRDKSKEIRNQIERSVPVGFNRNKKVRPSVDRWPGWHTAKDVSLADDSLIDRAIHQMGTLGNGNHFIELCEDLEGFVWVMLHSGSRGFGNVLARRHIESAKKLMDKMFITLPDPNLAYFVMDTPEYTKYLADLKWTQDYALQNRVEMMDRVMDQLSRLFETDIPRLMEINCHHNYAEMENHFGQNVLITRKGAIRARKGDLGIIPGSMGTKSFIVRGKGNPESYNSCSHGAGRTMSRTKAKNSFSVADLEAQTAGVECPKGKEFLDEIPGAYKPIQEVIDNQSDLIEVVAELKQFICIKG